MKTPDWKLASVRAYRARNAQKIAAQKKEYRQRHADYLRLWASRYYEANKERLRESKNAYKRRLRARPGVNRAAVAARRAAMMSAIPPWGDPEKVMTVYAKAKALGLQVDHIVPLTSDLVCGLHVWENLQLLAAAENVRKGNRWWPDCPE